MLTYCVDDGWADSGDHPVQEEGRRELGQEASWRDLL